MALRRVSGVAVLLLAWAARSQGQEGSRPIAATHLEGQGPGPAPPPAEMGPLATIAESLFGDAYAEGRWRPLTLGSFLTDGWREPWSAAPAGRDGLTPRNGWLGAFNGVFYRLWSADLGYVHGINAPYHGNRYAAGFSAFLPASRRFEVLVEDPFLVSNGTVARRRGYLAESGDLAVTARFLLAEDEATSRVFALAVRTPTGSRAGGGGVMALVPRYEFWTNPGGRWVARGSASFFVPIGDIPPPSHAALTGGLAIGRYFTPHDVPFGDLVIYAACDLDVPLDGTASTATAVSLGPGSRFHLGRDFFLLNFWGFPVTGPHPEAYEAQFAVVKVF